MSLSIPKGFQLTGVHCGIKSNPKKPDLTLLVSEHPVVAAGVYTQNLVFAAPVQLDRGRTPSDNIRTVVVNSGNANACTGEQGMVDALEMASLAAQACQAEPEQALVMSTGIIGERLPMKKIADGIHQAAGCLAADEKALHLAAQGILTTDLVEKLATRTLKAGDNLIQLTGMAKGSGMIGPNMATMLGLIMTDAALTPEDAQRLLASAVEKSFNCISVEGHTSTNDTVLLLASGDACKEKLSSRDLVEFGKTLEEICLELARAIPADGEGATHLIEIEVKGCKSFSNAKKIAKTIAESALVKTAITGAMPNWGRIVSAAGYSGVIFNPQGLDLYLNGTLLYKKGGPVEFDEPTVSASIRDNFQTNILLQLSEGNEQARFWTSDLTVDYIHINADYKT